MNSCVKLKDGRIGRLDIYSKLLSLQILEDGKFRITVSVPLNSIQSLVLCFFNELLV